MAGNLISESGQWFAAHAPARCGTEKGRNFRPVVVFFLRTIPRRKSALVLPWAEAKLKATISGQPRADQIMSRRNPAQRLNARRARSHAGSLTKWALSLALAGSLLSCPTTAPADPVSDFFRRLGDTIVNGPKRERARREAKSKPHRSRDDERGAHETGPDTSPSPTPAPIPTPEPVRAAVAVPAIRGERKDLRYGVPVPQQPGLVRSPWSPQEGLVDVSGFPSGTEVTDPFSGKTFLTP